MTIDTDEDAGAAWSDRGCSPEATATAPVAFLVFLASLIVTLLKFFYLQNKSLQRKFI